MSHVREDGAGKAFCLTGPPSSPGKAICLSGSGTAFCLVGIPVGNEDGPVSSLSCHLREWPTRCE